MTVCTDADIVTTALLAGDDELSRRLVELKKQKSSYEDQINMIQLKRDPANPDPVLGNQKHALDLKNESVDMQIRQIVNYKILTGDKQAGAYQKLAKAMMEQGNDAGATISLLNKIDDANPLDLSEVAKYFKQEGEDVATAVGRIRDSIANVGTALAEQEKYLKKTKSVDDLIKEGKKTKEEFKKAFEEKIEQDKKNIKEGLNPNNFADPDPEWTTIKNTIEGVENQQKAWMQYCLGNAIIGDADKKVLKAINSIYKASNTVGKLDPAQILKIDSLEELMARAYTNTLDLVEDGLLRDVYKDKLTSLMTGMGVSDKKTSQEYAKRLIRVARFADEGVAFSTIVRYDAVADAARKMGIKVDNAENFYKSLINTVKENKYLDNISEEGFVELSNGTKLTPGNVLELISIATGDKTLPRLLREGTFSETSLLSAATQVLLGNKTEATKKILKLMGKVKELPSIADSKELALMTLTGKKIQPGAPKKYFDYRSMYNQGDMLPETKKKAEFMERLSNAHRAEVAVDGLEDISNTKGVALEKKLRELQGGYLIVNDSGWMNNQDLKNAINRINNEIEDESQKIQVLFPRQSQMSNFTMQDGKLIFRSIDSGVFRDIMDNVSIRTLGDATATKELQADMFEMVNGMNGDKIRYQATYSVGTLDSTGKKISDQQTDFFNKSKMRDDDGNIVRAFRGRGDRTPGRAFGKGPKNNVAYEDQTVIFFSDSKRMGNMYAGSGYRKVTGKRIKTLADAKKEIKAKAMADYYFEITSPEKGRYQITTKNDFRGLYDDYKKGDVIFDGNIDELDRYLIDDYKNPINSWNDPRTYEAYLYAENPLVIDCKGNNWQHIEFNGEFQNTNQISVWAARNGYDGVIFKNVVERSNIGPVNDYVVFDESQIKGVDNLNPTVGDNWRYQIDKKYTINGLDISKYYALPTEEELDKYLETHNIEQELKDLFGVTENPNNAIFITKDGEFIDGYGLDENKYPLLAGIQIEHETVMDVLFYGDKRGIGNGLGTNSIAGKHLLPLVMGKTGLIRVRPQLNGSFGIQVGRKGKVSLRQERALGRIADEYNNSINGGKVMHIESSAGSYSIEIKQPTIPTSNIVNLINDAPEFKYSNFNSVVTSHNKEIDDIGKRINIGDKLEDNIKWETVGRAGFNEKDITATAAKKVKLFKTKRTVESIAKEYGIPIEIVEKIVTPEGEIAYGRYGFGIINLAETVKKSTAPHELFHAIFDLVDKDTKQTILENSKKLFSYSDRDAEEALADAFSQRFRTGKFDYADVSKLSKKEQKSFFTKVEEFFKKLKDWIEGVDAHRKEVQQLFDDMVNLKYLPNEGQPANKFKAVQKYNEGLEESANEYFAAMLGHPEWSNPNYRDTLHSMLENMTGIPIKDLRDLAGVDKTKLWRAVDTEFTNAQKTTGKFKNEVVDVTARMQQIENMSNEDLKKTVSKTLKGLINNEAFTEENIPLIKQALQDYETSQTVEEWLMNKGRLMSIANGGQAESFTIDELKNIFRNGTQATSYKNLFFPNQSLSEKETAKYVKQINDMLFDGLTASVAQNLVKMGYALPLDNVRQVVLGYLMGDINLNDPFVKAFLYKNGLREYKNIMESIIDSAMPRNFKLGYEDALYTLREEGVKSGLINRIVEEENPFLPDTYSSLVSLINTKIGNIANGSEVKYLSSLLDSYAKKVGEEVKKGITFEKAQQLKTQLGYALDIFEQDILMPKYGRFLTPDQKSAIRNMKSYVSIVVGKEGEEGVSKALNELKTTNGRIITTFTDALNDVLTKYNVVKGGLLGGEGEVTKKAVDKFKEKLKSDGTVMENVNGEIVIVDAKEQIKNNLDTMPNSVKGTEFITSLTGEEFEALDNRAAYFLNQLLESAKKLDAMSKWETAMMYTIDPELNMYRFFSAFRLVDDGGEKVPMALVGNILAGNKKLGEYNTMGINNILRKNIFDNIKQKFYSDGAININQLNEIIDKALKDNTSTLKQVFDVTKNSEYEDLLQQVRNQFQQAFMPYTHLKDIPSSSMNGITDVRGRINDTLAEQVDSIREAIDGMPEEYLDFLNRIEVTTPTGQTITIQQFLDGSLPNWKKAIFDDEDITVKTAEEFGLQIPKSADAKEAKKIEKINIDYRRKVSNQYNEVLQSIQNQQRVVTEGERKLTSRMLNNGRSMARKYSLTNRLVEATDMVSGLDEEASRMIKGWLLGFENIISFGRANREEPLKRLKEVQEAYKKFYAMGLDAVNNIAPKNEAEELAQHLCRYFKTLERHLGSADGSIGVTTRADINRAFYNIGEVFMNIRDIKGIYALQSAIEQNQILKFFRFSKSGQTSYVKAFTRPATEATEDIFGGYREYVSKMPDNINKDLFNDIFASDFTDVEFKTLYQALSGITYTGGWGKTLPRFMNFINGSNFIFRFLISYPGQLLTIPQQGIAYFLKQRGFEKQLGIDNMSEIDRVRNEYGTLVKAYNEINIFRDVNPDNLGASAYYNRYGLPDIADAYKGAAIELTDDVNDMYGKLMTYQSSWDNMGKIQRSLDAYKDNANNIIDGLFARNFKNIAFLKGIKENSFMQFGSVEAFEKFMKDNKIDQAIKNQLMDAVNASAGRNFRNILGLGFGGLDRAVGGSGLSNIFYGLMQFFNFRGAWGQNIFRNMGETFKSAFKMLPMGTSKEGRDAIATYIAQTPEFTNFISILFNDMQWTWKMLRYQDNNRWSELDNGYDIADFLDYTVELLNMTSQWWQGINSFGPARPILEAWGPEGSIWDSLRNPEVYKDTYGVGAFFNSLGTNAGRNWKPMNYFFQAMQALEEGGVEGVQAFLQNQFWKLSFGSLRYMMNEDSNDYGFTYDFLPDKSGIPSIIRGEGSLGSEKSFSYQLSNNNTWEAMKHLFNTEEGWETRSTYLGDLWGALINGSNVTSTIKNAVKAIPGYGEQMSNALGFGNRKSPWSFDSFTEVISKTKAGEELLRTGRVTPTTPSEVKAFINQFLDEDGETSNRSAYKPFGSKMAEAISNYNQLGHIKGEEPHSGDKEMEFMLSQIRYQRGEDGSFLKKNGKNIETDLWKNIVEYIRLHPTDMDATSRAVSKEIFKRVEENNDDPNYLLYQSLIGQGMADMYLDDAWTKYQDVYNSLYGGKKATTKITKTEAQGSGLYWDNFMKYLMNSKVSGSDVNLVEYLQNLDRNTAMNASIKIIKDQLSDDLDKATLERYVDFYTDSYGNEKVALNSQYASQIRALGGIGDAIDKGNLELMMARASSFANTYLKEDETGLVMASAITSLVNRVRQADISPKLKQEMIAALGENHAEFLQIHLPEIAKNLGLEEANELLKIVNEHIYEWDGAMNAAIGDAIMNGDGVTSKGSSASSKFKSALAVTSKLPNGAGTSGSGYGGRTSSTSTAKWVPYKIDIAKLLEATGGKGYSPKQIDINIRTYQPKVDLSIGKDINRTKKVQKTQEQKKSKVVL